LRNICRYNLNFARYLILIHESLEVRNCSRLICQNVEAIKRNTWISNHSLIALEFVLLLEIDFILKELGYVRTIDIRTISRIPNVLSVEQRRILITIRIYRCTASRHAVVQRPGLLDLKKTCVRRSGRRFRIQTCHIVFYTRRCRVWNNKKPLTGLFVVCVHFKQH